MKAPKVFVPVDYEVIRLIGGMDLVTPTLSLPPGYARDSINFESAVKGGYSRVGGYERFDGRPRPSDASFGTLTVNITGTIAVGNTITGVTSTATGVVFLVNGSTVAYTKGVGSFQSGETLNVGGVGQGTITALGSTLTDAKTAAQYANLAADVYRSDIAAPSGSGPVRGVAWLGSTLYAFRDNGGGTACVLYKSTSSGWSAVTLGKELAFTAGLPAGIAEGNTVTGATSGATGVVARVCVRTGSFASSNAVGTLVLSSTTGTFQAAENLQVGGTNRATCSGAQTQITLLPGGRYEFYADNFGGALGTKRLYGCDGVNPGFEFDGTTYAPIHTGMATDKPNHVVVHKNYLFFAFGASVQFSGIAAPFAWSPVLGAGEIVLGDPVTNFQIMPGDQSTGALAIFSRQETCMLYGTGASSFQKVPFQDSTGAFAYTSQNVVSTYALDDRGVMSIKSTLSFGNFDSASITQQIQPWLEQRQVLVTCSTVNRRKSQYRLFFSDSYALYVTLDNNKVIGCMPQLFGVAFNVACEGETSNGLQSIYVGGMDGMVYQLDVGTSFDGAEISATLPLVFDSIKSPRIRKRYRHGSIEAQGDGYAEFSFGYQLGYGSDEISQDVADSYTLPLSATFWDDFTWDDFVWDGRNLAPSEIDVDGTAENIACIVASQSDYFAPFTLNSITLHYTPRRGIRS